MKRHARMLHKELKNNGFVLDRTKGSHYIYKHKTNGYLISVPFNLNEMVERRLRNEMELMSLVR